MDYTQLVTQTLALLHRVHHCKDIVQSRFGKSDRFFHRYVAFETALKELCVCLGKIIDTVICEEEGGFLLSPMRLLPKTLTHDQQELFDTLMADIRTYESAFDTYSFGYHASLKQCRNGLLNKMNVLKL